MDNVQKTNNCRHEIYGLIKHGKCNYSGRQRFQILYQHLMTHSVNVLSGSCRISNVHSYSGFTARPKLNLSLLRPHRHSELSSDISIATVV
jgi:hypothetical protein